MKLPLLALAALLMSAAVLAPTAAASPSADLAAMIRDHARDDKLTPCRFTKNQLNNARTQISGDIDVYGKGIRSAINRELRRWRDGRCRGKRGGAKLKITKVRGTGDAGKEYVTIRNLAGKTVDLRNYALRDRDDHVLKFRSTKLKRGARLKVITGCRSGHRKPVRRGSSYYACRRAEVWDDVGDLVELLGPGGGLLSRKQYGELPA
ncbi:MAG TPA: lamin tail domain-containing protein [Solirubrobacteraceae bacterium]|nr:lamin tail domain-containing protein [Solirubrobacteraceae bacterium]